MANKKISELTELSAQPADGDLFAVVDVDDTTDAASGTTKKIQTSNLIKNASTTVKGIVEEATQAEVDAGTAAGATSARLAVNPSTIRAKAYHDYIADVGSTDAYAITASPAILAYATGQIFTFEANTANTGACTLAVCGLTATAIRKNVDQALTTGDIVAGQIVTVVYDGLNFQILSLKPKIVPIINKYIYTSVGATSTRFDITNTTGTTFRYTFDGTGTDPVISSATFPVGTQVYIKSTSMTLANTGYFTVTASSTNYFEVTNAAGVAENDKTLGGGYLKKNSSILWTKPAGLSYVIAEVQAGGGGSGGLDSDSSYGVASGGGGAGGYSRKIIGAASLGTTEAVTVGYGGFCGEGGSSPTDGVDGGISSFGSHCSATGGGKSSSTTGSGAGGTGGVGSLGDINIQGGGGNSGIGADDSGMGEHSGSGAGGSSVLGGGGAGGGGGVDADGLAGGLYGGGAGGAYSTDGSSQDGANGGDGIVIVTEFYH